MLTADWTFAFRDTGVILNTDPVLSTDPFVDITKVAGLDSADLRVTERDREGMDGGFLDAYFEKMRTIVLQGNIYNATELYMDTLKANFAPSDVSLPFYFDTPAIGERVIFCKSLGLKYDWDAQYSYGYVPFQVQLKAPDPTIYSSALTTLAAQLAGTETGFGFNLAFNFGFGGGAATLNAATFNNVGNKYADATIMFTGPVTNPKVVHDQTGGQLLFSITLGATDTLTVNLRNKTVLLNGTANRRGAMQGTSKWFFLQPGTNTLRFFGTAGAGTPLMNVYARSAYR